MKGAQRPNSHLLCMSCSSKKLLIQVAINFLALANTKVNEGCISNLCIDGEECVGVVSAVTVCTRHPVVSATMLGSYNLF